MHGKKPFFNQVLTCAIYIYIYIYLCPRPPKTNLCLTVLLQLTALRQLAVELALMLCFAQAVPLAVAAPVAHELFVALCCSRSSKVVDLVQYFTTLPPLPRPFCCSFSTLIVATSGHRSSTQDSLSYYGVLICATLVFLTTSSHVQPPSDYLPFLFVAFLEFVAFIYFFSFPSFVALCSI